MRQRSSSSARNDDGTPGNDAKNVEKYRDAQHYQDQPQQPMVWTNLWLLDTFVSNAHESSTDPMTTAVRRMRAIDAFRHLSDDAPSQSERSRSTLSIRSLENHRNRSWAVLFANTDIC